MKFRPLRADEVDCRIGIVKEGKGVSLLLYKDARCDMNILDETVGEMNWQKEYRRDNANCIVSIWDANKGQWISKEDTGTESATEAEKGLASDSFKRACFNWGIGRELYTAPFIWVFGATKKDRFWVKEMTVENRAITHLVICGCDDKGERTDIVAYEFPKKKAKTEAKSKSNSEQMTKQETKNDQKEAVADSHREEMIKEVLACYEPARLETMLHYYKCEKVEDLTDPQLITAYANRRPKK